MAKGKASKAKSSGKKVGSARAASKNNRNKSSARPKDKAAKKSTRAPASKRPVKADSGKKAVKTVKAGKITSSKTKPSAVSTKPSKPAFASTPAPSRSESERPAKPGTAPPPNSSIAAALPGLKKRNVKRGAPPMLPRRLARRPDNAPLTPPAPRPAITPGSHHAPARAPEGAESLKHRLETVMTLIAQLRGLKRTLARQFFDAGLLLQKLSDPTLYQAKGYGSFEKFIEREIERELSIGRALAQDLVSIVRVFQREAAEELGLDRLRVALRALWPEPGPQQATADDSTVGAS